ncbi:MAG: putative N-carbamoyl-beta-alanine amidohydrolase [Bradyrhizobium sp.]|jgi:N-carbamoyl-L-amino-acid hydrolase|nr:putative N-carbamoyl-beta-alanine amidohydrolase [Bradyrhizobium sp.]
MNVDGNRRAMMTDFHDLFGRFSALGATPKGGLCRLTASREDGLARRLLGEQIVARGGSLTVDPIGNMFGVFMLTPTSDRVVLAGSHLDSVPTGGRFDGNYGVVAALAAASSVVKRAAAFPGFVKRNLAVVNWTNEEGSRFLPSLLGSSVFTGKLPLAHALAIEDQAGISIQSALREIGYLGVERLRLTPVRYLEIHNEQGDRLEKAGINIGIVQAAWAARKICLHFAGEPSHTGPTPMELRRDALRCAAAAIGTLYEVTRGAALGVHASASRIEVTPNSPNVVASDARVWFEVRHSDADVTGRLGDEFLGHVRKLSEQLGVTIEIVTDDRREVFKLDADGVDLLRDVVTELDLSSVVLDTIAGHDALALQRIIPSSLIFVPCRDGLSHNEREFTEPHDLENGVAVVAEALWRMVTAT